MYDWSMNLIFERLNMILCIFVFIVTFATLVCTRYDGVVSHYSYSCIFCFDNKVKSKYKSNLIFFKHLFLYRYSNFVCRVFYTLIFLFVVIIVPICIISAVWVLSGFKIVICCVSIVWWIGYLDLCYYDRFWLCSIFLTTHWIF